MRIYFLILDRNGEEIDSDHYTKNEIYNLKSYIDQKNKLYLYFTTEEQTEYIDTCDEYLTLDKVQTFFEKNCFKYLLIENKNDLNLILE